MHDELKRRVGIEKANCETCTYLGSDGDGPEYNGSWPVCDKIDRFSYLESFPFKKEMECWEPNFWHTKFAELLVTEEDYDSHKGVESFYGALTALPDNCRHMWI